MQGGHGTAQPKAGLHQQAVAAGLDRCLDLALAVLLGDQQQGVQAGPALLDLQQ